MMSDRPTVDQNQTHQHLPVARLAIAAVAIGAKLGGSLALEIGRGQIVEHHVDPQREQVAQRQIKRMLDLRLALEQLIERAIPLLQLPRRYPHAWASAGLAFPIVAPRRDPTPAMTITDEIVLQPLRQRMLAAWARQAVGDQNQGALAERDAITASARAGLRQHMIETKLVPELTGRQARAPIPHQRQPRPRCAPLDQYAQRRAASGRACRDQDGSPADPCGRD